MSTFWMKGLALLAMTIDHVGLVFGREGWDLLPFDSSILRAIGRIAFPLFAFCLAQGWHKTHDRKKYFLNITRGAVASQIPFCMAFCAPNRMMGDGNGIQVHWMLSYLLFAMVAVWVYWHFILHEQGDRSLLLVAVAALLPGIQVQVQGFWFLCQNINVLYTFLMAFFCLYALEHRYDGKIKQRIGLCIGGSLLLIAYGLPADYGTGLLGIVLITGFAILPGKIYQALFLVLWSILFYAFFTENIWNILFCSAAAVGIFLYDPTAKSRFRAKKFFYWYYPAHLLILGVFNVGMRYW
ncbi:TraX family protein [Subdoligranulum variabile]|uniref:Protein TraX n=1 Tax=Subdoligranulum variabile DSM 15176 TaxID=411471 RepID=D1PKI8_9FIRM|nr:TraX family protein [Subdoligranulum variabile]EFB76496.1 hypothetical protein SUBVAR_04864 [Subdoligranulum variabile DSM 15176]UWP68260.1 conjugal transfer protein TraX [Subdoligranulum variabile]